MSGTNQTVQKSIQAELDKKIRQQGAWAAEEWMKLDEAVSHVKAMEGRAGLAGWTLIIPLLLKHRNESVTPAAMENYSKTPLYRHMGRRTACLPGWLTLAGRSLQGTQVHSQCLQTFGNTIHRKLLLTPDRDCSRKTLECTESSKVEFHF